MVELTELRQLKQPLEYPSCGSVFKRPVGHYTGKLIQDAGLQGMKWGGAQTILEKFGVTLETEVRIIGEEV